MESDVSSDDSSPDELTTGESDQQHMRSRSDLTSSDETCSEAESDDQTNHDESCFVGRHRSSSPSAVMTTSTPLDTCFQTEHQRSVETEVSGDVSIAQAQELVEAFRPRGAESSISTSVDRREDADHAVSEVNVQVTQTLIQNPTAITVGGQVIVQPPSPKKYKPQRQATEIQTLRIDTEKRFERWTKGMIKTRGVQKVLDKIIQGRTFVLITGSPGEGKTTAAYLVLQHLFNKGRQVYDIVTPEDYFKAKKERQPVLLFNDILGSLHFDLDKRWKEVLNDLLAMAEHKGPTMETVNRKQNEPTVIITCRSNILKEASDQLGRFKDLLLKEENTVDLTHGVDTFPTERLNIWRYHSSLYNTHINEKLLREICRLDLPHGFPHCCRLFAEMQSRKKELDVVSFFLNPLEFLNQTVASLMTKKVTGNLLRDLLKNEGCLNLDSMEDDEKRFQYSESVETLSGTYLSFEDGFVSFHHSSVYDSAAFVVCKKDPMFVIKNCSLKFLNERVKIDGLEYGNYQQHFNTVTVDKRHLPTFIQRLRKEFDKSQLSFILMQQAFHDETFTAQFMHSLLQCQQTETNDSNLFHQLLYKKDKASNKTFMFLATKSRSDKVLKYILNSIELTMGEIKDTLFGICEHISVSALRMLGDRYELDMNATDSEKQTPLSIASTKGSEEFLKMILERDVDVNAVDKHGDSALNNISRYGVDGDGEVVKMLIEKGADVNKKSSVYPWLILNMACNKGHLSVVVALLESKVDVNKTNSGLVSPLHDASYRGHKNIVTHLLNNGADINKANGIGNEGKTPLIDASFGGHLEVVKILLDRGADINITSIVGKRTPLHYACLMGHADISKFFLDRGVDVNEQNASGFTALHFACYLGYLDIVSMLLEKGANVNKASTDGVTPLHVASFNGNAGAVTILVKSRAEVNIRNGSKYGRRTPLLEACYQSHLEVITALLDGGGDVNMPSGKSATPLYVASSMEDVNVVNLLLDRGAKADVGYPGVCSRKRPLHGACFSGHSDVATALMNKKLKKTMQ